MHEIEFILLPKYNRSDYIYGYSTNQNASLSQITNWQESPYFNMPEGTYIFYAKKKTGKKHFKKIWTVSCIDCNIHLVSFETVNDCMIQSLKAYMPSVVNICTISSLNAYYPSTYHHSVISFDGIIGINI